MCHPAHTHTRTCTPTSRLVLRSTAFTLPVGGSPINEATKQIKLSPIIFNNLSNFLVEASNPRVEAELTNNGDEYQETKDQSPEDDRGIGERQPVGGRVRSLVYAFLHDVRDIILSVPAGSSMYVGYHLLK